MSLFVCHQTLQSEHRYDVSIYYVTVEMESGQLCSWFFTKSFKVWLIVSSDPVDVPSHAHCSLLHKLTVKLWVTPQTECRKDDTSQSTHTRPVSSMLRLYGDNDNKNLLKIHYTFGKCSGMAYGLQAAAGDLSPRQSAGSVTDWGLSAGSTTQHFNFSKAQYSDSGVSAAPVCTSLNIWFTHLSHKNKFS